MPMKTANPTTTLATKPGEEEEDELLALDGVVVVVVVVVGVLFESPSLSLELESVLPRR